MIFFYLYLIALLFNIYYKNKTLYNCPDNMKISYSKFIQYVFSTSLVQYIIWWITNNFLIYTLYIVFPEYKDIKLLQLFKDLRTYILLSFITTISCFIKAEFTIFKKNAKK